MSCLVCSEGGEYFRATPKAEAEHFTARAYWALHRARQAREALGEHAKAALLGALTKELESITEETQPNDH